MARLFHQEVASAGLALAFDNADAAGDVLASGAQIGGWAHPVALLARNVDALAAREVSMNGLQVTLQPGEIGIIPAWGPRAKLDALVDVSYSDPSNVLVAAIRLYDRSGVQI